jgi:hypothetical protein
MEVNRWATADVVLCRKNVSEEVYLKSNQLKKFGQWKATFTHHPHHPLACLLFPSCNAYIVGTLTTQAGIHMSGMCVNYGKQLARFVWRMIFITV